MFSFIELFQLIKSQRRYQLNTVTEVKVKLIISNEQILKLCVSVLESQIDSGKDKHKNADAPCNVTYTLHDGK